MSESIVSKHRTILTFSINGTFYCFDSVYVKEVQHCTEITRVPLTAPCIRGLVTIRGQVVLVVDIMRLFDEHRYTSEDSPALILFKSAMEISQSTRSEIQVDQSLFSEKLIAVQADQILDVITMDDKKFDAPPDHLSQQALRFIESVTFIDSEPYCMLNPALLIGSINQLTNDFHQGVSHA